jgi:hypothetical protein
MGIRIGFQLEILRRIGQSVEDLKQIAGSVGKNVVLQRNMKSYALVAQWRRQQTVNL